MTDHTSDADVAVVRLFVGHAGSPVWFRGDVDLDELLVDDELTRDLRAWEEDWYAGRELNTFEWVGPGPEVEHLRRGVDLAYRLSRALGSAVVVEVDPAVERTGEGTEDPVQRLRIRSDRPPSQPAAAAQVAAWAAEDRAWRAQVRTASREGWSAYAPLSGESFPPARRQRPRR